MTDASGMGPLDVGSLLASIGLEQLADVFRAHDIDGEVLPGLVEADLRELGLTLGQRKKLLIEGLRRRGYNLVETALQAPKTILRERQLAAQAEE